MLVYLCQCTCLWLLTTVHALLHTHRLSYCTALLCYRAAMAGMLAAFGAEVNTRAPILKQIQTAPVFVASAFAIIILASGACSSHIDIHSDRKVQAVPRLMCCQRMDSHFCRCGLSGGIHGRQHTHCSHAIRMAAAPCQRLCSALETLTSNCG